MSVNMNAAILSFPDTALRSAKRRMNRTELDARHSWIMHNSSKWETSELDGVRYVDANVKQLMDVVRKAWPDKYPPLTMAKMRKNISERRAVIAKRNCVKAWLKSLGADLGSITSSEQALFFLFDRLVGEDLAG